MKQPMKSKLSVTWGMPAITLVFLLCSLSSSAADFIVDEVDHARKISLWNVELYERYDHESFMDFHPFHHRISFTDIDYPLLHAALFFESNRVRVENGISSLPWNIQLEITAYNHSRFMVNQFEFAHYSGHTFRRTPNDRGKLAGIVNPQIAENIAINFALDYIEGTPFYVHGQDLYSYTKNPRDTLEVLTYLEFARRAVQLWMDSPPHRRNLLSPNAVQLATGAYFFRESNSGYFPKFRTTQNFQWWTEIVSTESIDPLPPGYRLKTK